MAQASGKYLWGIVGISLHLRKVDEDGRDRRNFGTASLNVQH